ncbi:MAG: HAD family hydrolase, partial [Dehalococcoidia bacterium]|nr:HAD family hydrolase [Dehalococcoidia bacterium]
PPPAEGAPAVRRITPRPDAEVTLLGIRGRGLHVGAVSNADVDQFSWMMDGLGFRHHFDSLICSEEVESCKPDAKIFLEALRRAGCDPHEALFVGDTPDHDIAGAERVGMRTALIIEEGGPGFERGQPKPGQVVIRELREVLELL